MLKIIDLNSSSECLQEIVELKKGFLNCLTPTVKHGEVIIINNFPAHVVIDYLIVINIENRDRNYLYINHNKSRYYIDNIVLAISKLGEHNVIIDNGKLHDSDAIFDFIEENKIFNNELKNFFNSFNNFNRIYCYSLFHASSLKSNEYFSPQLTFGKITAEKILYSYAIQRINNYEKINRISAFTKDTDEKLDIEKFVNDIINTSNDRFNHGILTKKKLELIAKHKNKSLDEVYDNIGNSITIITGKAGTGKTVFLLRSIYKRLANKRRARFLTFNNLLVKDIKCTLRTYGNFNPSNFSSSTIHQYFYRLVKDMGISLILGETRVNELLEICAIRFDKFEPTYNIIKNRIGFNEKFLLEDIKQRERNESDYAEFKEIANFFVEDVKDFTSWNTIKKDYLDKKRKLLLNFVGAKVFIEDYNKVLETLYFSITESEKFYQDFDIANRYELLSFIYKVDNKENIVTYNDLLKQVKFLRRSANWSCLFIDEGQDCEHYEKQILFELRSPENIVVATGQKEQLIRRSRVTVWNSSNNRLIASNQKRLYNTSYRQKENIIQFVNKLANQYKIDVKLKNDSSSKGLGKIILDLRTEKSLYDIDKIKNLLFYGKLNECSVYESLMILISSKYVEFNSQETFHVDATDHFKKQTKKTNRKLKYENILEKEGISVWSGIAENKSELEVPFQNQTRIISYDSCRGLEAWSVMCLDLDNFIDAKINCDEAEEYLADDLFLKENERREKYALTWLLMVFTRPVDTLYLDLRKRSNPISEKIVEILRTLKGVETLE